jgi:hypothetical protein
VAVAVAAPEGWQPSIPDLRPVAGCSRGSPRPWGAQPVSIDASVGSVVRRGRWAGDGGEPEPAVMMTILSSESPSVRTSQSTVTLPTDGWSTVLWSSRWAATCPVAHSSANLLLPAFRSWISAARRLSRGKRPVARRRSETTAASVASRSASVTGHSARWAGPACTGNLSRAKLRSRGGEAQGSPSSAAHPRFHHAICQSAANTATATSPRRASTRWTPGGRWSEIAPSTGGTSWASRYRWSRSAVDSCRARARDATTGAEGVVARPCSRRTT